MTLHLDSFPLKYLLKSGIAKGKRILKKQAETTDRQNEVSGPYLMLGTCYSHKSYQQFFKVEIIPTQRWTTEAQKEKLPKDQS